MILQDALSTRHFPEEKRVGKEKKRLKFYLMAVDNAGEFSGPFFPFSSNKRAHSWVSLPI